MCVGEGAEKCGEVRRRCGEVRVSRRDCGEGAETVRRGAGAEKVRRGAEKVQTGAEEFLKQVEIVQLSDAGVATPAVSFELCPDERTVHSRMGRRISLSSS